MWLVVCCIFHFIVDTVETANTLYEELLRDYPDHILSHTSYLQSFDPIEPKRQLPVFNKEHTIKVDDLKRVISVCDAAIDSIKQDSLLAYFSVKHDVRSDSAKIKT